MLPLAFKAAGGLENFGHCQVLLAWHGHDFGHVAMIVNHPLWHSRAGVFHSRCYFNSLSVPCAVGT